MCMKGRKITVGATGFAQYISQWVCFRQIECIAVFVCCLFGCIFIASFLCVTCLCTDFAAAAADSVWIFTTRNNVNKYAINVLYLSNAPIQTCCDRYNIRVTFSFASGFCVLFTFVVFFSPFLCCNHFTLSILSM